MFFLYKEHEDSVASTCAPNGDFAVLRNHYVVAVAMGTVSVSTSQFLLRVKGTTSIKLKSFSYRVRYSVSFGFFF